VLRGSKKYYVVETLDTSHGQFASIITSIHIIAHFHRFTNSTAVMRTVPRSDGSSHELPVQYFSHARVELVATNF
jgi:hypothetical protein